MCSSDLVTASAVAGQGSDERWVEASVRSVAVELGVSKSAAHRALHVLRRSGLIVAVQHRGRGGRFDVGMYVVAVSTEIVQPRPEVNSSQHPAPASDSVVFSSAVPSGPASRPRQVEQLVLRPSE